MPSFRRMPVAAERPTSFSVRVRSVDALPVGMSVFPEEGKTERVRPLPRFPGFTTEPLRCRLFVLFDGDFHRAPFLFRAVSSRIKPIHEGVKAEGIFPG